MATQFISNSWLMPTNANKDKLSNYSLDFNGVDEFINIGSDLFTGSGISEISMSLWVKFVDASPSDTIIAKDDVSGTNPRNFLIQAVGSTLYFNTSTNGTSFSSSQTVSTSTYDFLDQQWHHFVFVYKAGSGGSAEKSIYIDGAARVSDTSSAFSDIFNTTNVDIRIARRGDNARPLDGNITEVAIFDYALSASQVTDVYGTGSAVGNPMSLTTKPVAYYPLGDSAFNGEFLATNNATELYENYALDFDGTDDYIDLGSGLDYFDYESGSYSVSCWTKWTGTIYNKPIMNFGDNNFKFSLWQSPGNSGNSISVQLNKGGGQKLILSAWNRSGVTLNDGNWHHICIVIRQNTGATTPFATAWAGLFDVYIDGSNVTTGGYSGFYTITADNTLSGSAKFMDGSLSNCSIYNSALTSGQVTTLYNSGKPFDLNTFAVTPVSWWRLGATGSSFNGTNFTILDEIGSSNGTSANMTQSALVDGVGASGNGTSSGMSSGTNKTGDSPYSSNNAVSYNMSVLAESTSVPT